MRHRTTGIHKRILAIMPGLLIACALAGPESVDVGRFDAANPEPPHPWTVITMNKNIPPTQYRVIDWDGIAAVESLAIGSMALLARPLDIDLQKTPVLCWRWRIDAPVYAADMTSKAGDDYAARVYVSFDMPDSEIGLGTRMKLALARGLFGHQVPDAAINYVWDNTHPVGTQQPNAYTNRAQMFVLRSGELEAGQWVTERRNVQQDFSDAFAESDASAVQLALASDTDNTGADARAGFADFHFVAAQSACQFETRDQSESD